MTMSPAAFDDFVQSLRSVFFALRGLSGQLLEDVECSAAERGILLELTLAGPQTVPQLAASRAVSRQAMQKWVDGLVARDRVEAQPNPLHQRSMLIAATASGRELLREVRARERRLCEALDFPVTEAELRRMTQQLKKLDALLASSDVAKLARAPAAATRSKSSRRRTRS